MTEMDQGPQVFQAASHLITIQRLEPGGPYAFYAERRDGGRHHQRLAQGGALEVALAGQVAHQRARESIAGARRIDLDLQRVGRREEDPVIVEEHGAVLASLHHQAARAHGADRGGGLLDVVFPGELADLFVVDDERIDLGEHRDQGRPLAADPEIHGVGGDQPRALHLSQDLELEAGVDVAEQQKGARAEGLRQLGSEVGEDVELGVQRGAAREVRRVAARPAEGLARRPLDAGRVYAARRERVDGAIGEIVADHRHHAHRCEERGRQRRVGGRPANDVLGVLAGQLEVVEGHRPDDEDGVIGTIVADHVRLTRGGA